MYQACSWLWVFVHATSQPGKASFTFPPGEFLSWSFQTCPEITSCGQAPLATYILFIFLFPAFLRGLEPSLQRLVWMNARNIWVKGGIRKLNDAGQVIFLCGWLCNFLDYSPPSSSVHGIFQARVLEWVAISSSRGSSNPGIKPASPVSPTLQADSLSTEPSGKPAPGS